MTARERPGDPHLTPELVRQHGLTPEEYDRIRAILAREPTYVELGIFSALWNEHCAYKHSRPVLKTFPTDGPQVVQGPGENAGVLRIGDGWAAAFKMESHNHPSAVEPYQGAATGVGGDVAFEPAYEGNPLVNAMCVGLLREDELIRARAAGPGNPIIAVGAKRGRDGIHGASFASEELSEQSQARRPQCCSAKTRLAPW